MSALAILAACTAILLALVIGIALGRAYTLREVREAQADALRFARGKTILAAGIRSRAERAAGMVP